MCAELARYHQMKSFDHYCLFDTVSSALRLRDKIALFTYFQIHGWKRLLFVMLPEAIITLYYQQTLAHDCANGAENSHCPVTPINTDTVIFKLVVVLIMIAFFSIAMLMYPLIRCCIAEDLGSLEFDLREYCAFQVDREMCQVLRAKGFGNQAMLAGGQLVSDPVPVEDKDGAGAAPTGDMVVSITADQAMGGMGGGGMGGDQGMGGMGGMGGMDQSVGVVPVADGAKAINCGSCGALLNIDASTPSGAVFACPTCGTQNAAP